MALLAFCPHKQHAARLQAPCPTRNNAPPQGNPFFMVSAKLRQSRRVRNLGTSVTPRGPVEFAKLGAGIVVSRNSAEVSQINVEFPPSSIVIGPNPRHVTIPPPSCPVRGSFEVGRTCVF